MPGSFLVVAVAALLCGGVAGAADVETASLGDALTLRPAVASGSLDLRVTGPEGLVAEQRFAAGAAVEIALHRADGSSLPDGSYNWELRAVAPELRTRGEAEAGGGVVEDAGAFASGSFRVQQGAVVVGGAEVEGGSSGPRLRTAAPNLVPLDQVIPDDLIVQGSLCTGFDCVNNESFGFDTIRLKENNLRIKFEDTSVGSFPTNDWQLLANDSASGGQSKFSIEDVTGARVPFTVLAGAATNSIFVDSTGRVGFRTSTPVLDLHVNTSNTPALRLEQNNSGGFTAQTWDVGGNEANFFVRDVTGGSRLSFRIRPGAPTSSIDIAADGDVGIGTASPDGALHVARSTGAVAALARLSNNSGVQLLFDRTDAGANDWQMSNFNTSFQISVPGAATPQFNQNTNGNLTIAGTLTELSSKTVKENFVPVDGRDILRRLSSLPLATWNRQSDPTQRHLGPFAEDWYATFGLGEDNKHVGIADLSGVALAAIQGLNAELIEKDRALGAQEARLQALESQNAVLLERLERLESLRAAGQP